MESSNKELDRISELPTKVLDQILSKLWIKDAMKTSVLSTEWRYRYATRPSLVFDDSLLHGPLFLLLTMFKQDEEDIANGYKLVSLVDRVLLLHSGKIDEFEFSVRCYVPSEEIEKWILYLSRHHDLKVLVITRYAKIFRVPSSIYSFKGLTYLKLRSCSLKPPSAFKGFKNLKSLDLDWVDISEDGLERLIFSSPVLEKLTISYCSDIVNLCVTAPNLQHLAIKGHFIRLNLKKTPRLTALSIDTEYEEWRDGVNFRKLLAEIPQIERLDIGHCMTIGKKTAKIRRSLVNLLHVSIGVNFSEFREMLYLIGLLNCSPNLQELDIECLDEEKSKSITRESEDLKGPFTSLRYLKLRYMSGSKAEMDFIRFVLSTSPTLERMIISTKFADEKNMSTVMTKLLSFSHASPKAKIVIS